MVKTYSAKKEDIEVKWHLINADGKVLGKLAVEVSNLLVGKHKVTYSPNLISGDKVVVINSRKIRLTGKKTEQKIYYSHSGMVGKLKEVTFEQMSRRNPNEIIRRAVKGMLPKNRLRKRRLANLYIYEGSDHPYGGSIGN